MLDRMYRQTTRKFGESTKPEQDNDDSDDEESDEPDQNERGSQRDSLASRVSTGDPNGQILYELSEEVTLLREEVGALRIAYKQTVQELNKLKGELRQLSSAKAESGKPTAQSGRRHASPAKSPPSPTPSQKVIRMDTVPIEI